ncbi:MAG: S41 family peptidase [Ilumatobacteraceae bacterium]
MAENKIKLAPGHGLGTVRSMTEFRADVEQASLTEAQRMTLVDQAEILLAGLYVHLPLKRAMHAVDPLQRLRLIRYRLAELTEPEFHMEMQRIFIGLRDLHTNYILPSHYRGFAFLGVLIERCVEDGNPRWIVTKTFDHLTADPHLTVGAHVTHWNGSPMRLAVEANAAREAGSNKPARLARGLENMTIRPVTMSLPPDEDWVQLTYEVEGATHETRLPWRVFESGEDLAPGDARAKLPVGVAAPISHLVGLDLRTELTRQVKRRLFAPGSLREASRIARRAQAVPRATKAQAADNVMPTSRPGELKARIVETQHGTFGHLRIYTFSMEDGDIEAFLNEVARLLSVLPPEGLILDVRGNGGGYVIASEFLLQFFSPRRIQPEPMQFVSNPSTSALCRTVGDYQEWSTSIDDSVTTGAPYSTAHPLYPDDVVNSVGQLYQGPVTLITDALCYSATDIFASGFQDHEIGPVLGVDGNTGAGGANVVTHDDLRADWKNGPLRKLPKGAMFRVSLRRCLRVGARFGQPVEDLGVIPDAVHQLTRRDVTENNVDLMDAAGKLLAAMNPRRLTATAKPTASGKLALSIDSMAVTSVDVYVDGRPVTTVLVDDHGTMKVTIAHPEAGSVIRLAGFDGEQLVASQQQVVSAQ